jgi:hypothetical protein
MMTAIAIIKPTTIVVHMMMCSGMVQVSSGRMPAHSASCVPANLRVLARQDAQTLHLVGDEPHALRVSTAS